MNDEIIQHNLERLANFFFNLPHNEPRTLMVSRVANPKPQAERNNESSQRLY